MRRIYDIITVTVSCSVAVFYHYFADLCILYINRRFDNLDFYKNKLKKIQMFILWTYISAIITDAYIEYVQNKIKKNVVYGGLYGVK